MNPESISKRDSNFELLRILCMFLIIFHHFSVHGGYTGFSSFWLGENVVKFFAIGGKIGVNVFVLISGYFLLNSKFKASKLLTLVFQTVFYSVTIYLIFLIFGNEHFSFTTLIKYCFPITFSMYWFMTIFVLLYILSPFIKAMILNISKKQHLFLMVFLVVLQSIIPKLIHLSYFKELGWFVTLYIIATYVKLYGFKLLDSKIWTALGFLISFILISVLYSFFNTNMWNLTDLLCLSASIFLFCFFKNTPIKHNSFINIISSTTLGVYLIHDNNFIRRWLWQNLLKCSTMAYSTYFLLFCLGVCVAVFIVCSIIELIRKYVIEKYINKLVKKSITKIKLNNKTNTNQIQDNDIKSNNN